MSSMRHSFGSLRSVRQISYLPAQLLPKVRRNKALTKNHLQFNECTIVLAFQPCNRSLGLGITIRQCLQRHSPKELTIVPSMNCIVVISHSN